MVNNIFQNVLSLSIAMCRSMYYAYWISVRQFLRQKRLNNWWQAITVTTTTHKPPFIWITVNLESETYGCIFLTEIDIFYNSFNFLTLCWFFCLADFFFDLQLQKIYWNHALFGFLSLFRTKKSIYIMTYHYWSLLVHVYLKTYKKINNKN
jgi:hypothetical protein